MSKTVRRMNQTPKRQMTNTVSCGICAVMIGNSKPTAKEPIQLADDAAPEARLRIANGKTSPTSTQVNGAHVNE